MTEQQTPHQTSLPLLPGAGAVPFLLLVDDEEAFTEALSFRLETRDIPCLVAHRGERALELLHHPELEVVLLDLNMPGLHGLEALRRIKAMRPDVEVLLLTGEADFSVAATGMRRGAGDYLVKPVDFDALLLSIAKARQRAREHRERLRAAEAGKLIALGALAAGVGHEINNPLQIILQRSEWLQELIEDAQNDRADFGEMQKTADIIREQVRRAGTITSQLLEVAHKSRAGTAESDVYEATGRMARLFGERAAELGVAMTLDLAPALPRLPCSQAEIEPVLMHLVRNALDAIEALRPAADAPENAQARLRVSAAVRDGFVTIRVEDGGEGIAPEAVPHIFDPFFSTRPVGKGTGLGLTVCHSIVTALGGSIRYSPAPSRGAVFSVDIPIARDEPENRKAAPRHDQSPV